ncbi:MAG: hypothetical protein WA921_04185 [Ahrensia sp.]
MIHPSAKALTRTVALTIMWALGVHGALAQSVTALATEGDVTAVVQTPAGSFIETTRGTFRLSAGACDAGMCVKPDVIRGLAPRAPEGALPDGSVATAATGDIRRAWFGRPTTRYAHGVLGDAVEAGSLIAQRADGSSVEVVLPDAQVFEDITPRLYDFGGDGRNEIVVIRASNTGGGAVVVYGINEAGELAIVAESAENGRPNRWLNIAGIAGDTVYFVRTPHIGGRLATLTVTGGTVTAKDDILTGVSNHLIGSRELGLSAFLEGNAGRDLFIPTQARTSLRAIGGKYNDVALPGKIDKAIIAVGNTLVTATEDGQLLVIRP